MSQKYGLTMSKLRFRFDDEGEFIIWKGEDAPIAFIYNDLPELLIGILCVLREEKQKYSFSRQRYGLFKVDRDKKGGCRLHANAG